MTSMPAWEHPRLGRFIYDGMAWTQTVNVPAFKAFTSHSRYFDMPRSKGRHRLEFEADNEMDIPSATAIALATTVLENQADLVGEITRALWDDFNGRGPDSGMWWHGNLDEVVLNMGSEKRPSGADDLLPLLKVSQIGVRKQADGYPEPIVEISFHAEFEPEHGVGVLTDGHVVLGTGYHLDVMPFKTQ
jgi:hypothetical protein